VRLYELAADDRGEKYQRPLGQATWMQTPERKSPRFILAVSSRPTTDTLHLVTDNGDNPPLELESFQFYYPVTRVLFKSSSTTPVLLYYGNRQAHAPSYDLGLVARQLLEADKAAVSLGAEELLKKSAWGEAGGTGRGGVLFWGALSLVVVALLILIARLLPRPKDRP